MSMNGINNNTEQTMNVHSRTTSEPLLNFLVKRFNGGRSNGEFGQPTSFLITQNSKDVPLWLYGNSAIPLNKKPNGETFTPLGGQVFTINDPQFFISALIPGTDGLYLNSLDSANNLSVWRRVTKPDGASDPFTDWISEFPGDPTPSIYALKTNTADISVSKNNSTIETEMILNKADSGSKNVKCFVYDHQNYEDNSFIVSDTREILNPDRTVFHPSTGNLENLLQNEVKNIVKLNDGFYAFPADDENNAIYKAASSPKTATWIPDSTYDVRRNINSYYVGYEDYVNSHGSLMPKIRYNSSKTLNLWNHVSTVGDKFTRDPVTQTFSPASFMSNSFTGCLICNDDDKKRRNAIGGFVSSSSPSTIDLSFVTKTYEWQWSANNISVMTEWNVPDVAHRQPTKYGSFDFRGMLSSSTSGPDTSFYSHVFGNVYGSGINAHGAVLSTAVYHHSEIFPDGSYYCWKFRFPANTVYPSILSTCLINGSATELSCSSSNNLDVFTAVPVLSSGVVGVLVFLHRSSGYNWSKPDLFATIDVGSTRQNNVMVDDVMLLNDDDANLYVTVRNNLNSNVSVFVCPNIVYYMDDSQDEPPDEYNKIEFDKLPTSGQSVDKWQNYMIYNVIKSRNSNAALVDFQANGIRTVALRNNSGNWSLPFTGGGSEPSTFPTEVIDYAKFYGVDGVPSLAALNNIIKYSQIYYTDMLGSWQLSSTCGRIISGNDIYRFKFDGTKSKTSISDETTILASNALVYSTCPAEWGDSTDVNDFKIQSFDGGTAMTGVYVDYISPEITPSGYFYVSIYIISKQAGQSPKLTSHSYCLLRRNPDNGNITRIKTIPHKSGFSYPLAPDSWNFLDSSSKLPHILACSYNSLLKDEVIRCNPDSWKVMGTVNVSNGSGRYITMDDGKVVTWNSSKNIYVINPSNLSYTTLTITSIDSDKTIVGLQGTTNKIYAFTASTPVAGKTSLKIYSIAYPITIESRFTETARVTDIDFLTTGSIYMGYPADGSPGDFRLFYSSTDGGIKSVKSKYYSIECEPVSSPRDRNPKISEINFDGTVFKSSNGSILASVGGGNLYEIALDNSLEMQRLYPKHITQYAPGFKDAWINYKANNVSSYTIINNSNHVILTELSSNNSKSEYSGITNEAGQQPSIYDVSPRTRASLSTHINFYSDNGIIYNLKTNKETVPDNAIEVENGRGLLSNMIRIFLTAGQIREAQEEGEAILSVGKLLQFHVPYFTVDIGSSPSVYIDTLYNTAEFLDDFGQTYWTVQLQLDNMVSSMINDKEVAISHVRQRIKLGEPYDKPLYFDTLWNRNTADAIVALTSRDRPSIYRTEKRSDWETTHMRKAIREQGHIDNVADRLVINPDDINIVNDLPAAYGTNVMLLQDGDMMAVYEQWRRDIPYFGTCVLPYTMFNSRLQEISVPVISKYGDSDYNFVLGTTEGFVHLLNGRLFTKGVYKNEDDDEIVLSGNCTFASCHEVFDGTSIHNKFMFANDHCLYHINEHEFLADCDIKNLFELTKETINDIVWIGDNSYVICTNKGIYTAQPKTIIRDYFKDYMLSDLNNIMDVEFSKLLEEHRRLRHFAGSDIDIINHKIDRNFNPYPAGFTDTSPVVTSRHILNVDNDLVDTMEVRLTDTQALNSSSNIFAAIKNNVVMGIAAGTRSYAPAGWYDRVVDPNDENHVVDYSDIRYICRRWHSGIVEFYIYVPTTFTYYMNNLAGYSESPYTGLQLVRPNIRNMQLANDVNKQCTYLRLFINNTLYKLNTIYTVEIVANSLPLKMYMDSTYCDSNRAGLFDSLVEPSVVRSLPLMIGRSKNNVNALLNASNQITLEFAMYGSDAQAIHIMAR